jgi:hypothetical protein
MSLKFLKNLNGNNTGHFEKYLSSIKSIEDLSISWYPSSGEDFRNIVILNEVFVESQLKDGKKWKQPDLFIYTDHDKLEFDNLFPDEMTEEFTQPMTEMESLLTGINNVQTRTKFGDTTLLAGGEISIYSSNVSTDSVTISATALATVGTTAGLALTVSTTVAAATASTSVANFQAISAATVLYITGLDTQRGLLGAVQNQMDYSINNITELSTNLISARSRIIDTDYATETANLTKGQILQQAATAMLAQANQMPNVILSLLK